MLHLITRAAGEHGGTQHQENVSHDRTDDGGLNYIMKSGAERSERAIMSSAALPNVALRSPPTPSPARSASCSVARPSHPAKGRIAIAAATKINKWLCGERYSS